MLKSYSSQRGSAMAEFHLPSIWADRFSRLCSDCGGHVGIPHLPPCDTLSEAMGTTTVSGSIVQMARSRLTVTPGSIIRVLFMVPIYAAVSFLSFYFYRHSVYYAVLRDCYEAFAIASFFALLCHYIAPDLHSQKDYFRGLKPRSWVVPLNWFKKCCGGERGMWRTPRSGLTWFNVCTVLLHRDGIGADRAYRSSGWEYSNTASFGSQ